MSNAADSESRSRAELVITKGSQLAGALVGGGVVAFGGPPGAALGAAAGWAVSEVLVGIGLEVMSRMTERAAQRTAATVLLVERDTQEHEQRGEMPRHDGFFDDRGELRPEAHELFEAVLLTAANTYEERKLPYLAHLFDGVAHDASVRTADALFLSRIADQLTYRQLRGLAVVGRHKEHEMPLVLAKTGHEDGSTVPDPAFMREFDDLGNRGLVGVESTSVIVRSPADLVGGNALNNYPYAQARLTSSGELLCRLMRLDEMPATEQQEWLAELAGAPRVPAS